MNSPINLNRSIMPRSKKRSLSLTPKRKFKRLIPGGRKRSKSPSISLSPKRKIFSEFQNNDINTTFGKMFVKHRFTVTFNGFEKSLLVSALQKYIRRGMFEKAAWCLMELDYFKLLLNPEIMKDYLQKYPDRESKQTISLIKGIQTNTVNRLRVICVEDVGIGQVGVCQIVNDLINKWEKSNRMDSSILIEIVKILCSVRKLRYLSDLKSVFHLPPFYGSSDSEEKRII